MTSSSKQLVRIGLIMTSMLLLTPAFAQTQSRWSQAKIPQVIPFGKAIGTHGDAPKFKFAPDIPTWPSSRWTPAPDPNSVGFAAPSRLCGTKNDCFHAADFIFFHTEVTFPTGYVLQTFKIRGWGIDDGMRVTIFNSKYPKGISPTGGFINYNQINKSGPEKGAGTTADLSGYIQVAETNRIVLTIMDDCCSEMALQAVELLVNGAAIKSANLPPKFTSKPPTAATPSQEYRYQSKAQDPEGDTITYTLRSQPQGATVNPKTGEVTWTPQPGDRGKTVEFVLEACDSKGNCVKQTWSVQVDSPQNNTPPRITSTPGKLAKEGSTYEYIITANDPDPNDVLTFSIKRAPTNATINAKSGRLTWKVPPGSAGKSFEFKVSACDTSNACATQDFIVEVRAKEANNLPPKITSTPPTIAYVGLRYIYIINAVDPDIDDVLEGSQKSAPKGTRIDAKRLFLTWTPTIDDQGKTFEMSVAVCDPHKACDQQQWKVQVKTTTTTKDNHHPRFVTRPRLNAASDSVYLYAFEAIDPNPSDTVTYQLRDAPTGTEHAKEKRTLTWKVPPALRGKSVNFRILACDQHNACTEQEWQVNIPSRCLVDDDCQTQQSCQQGICTNKTSSFDPKQLYTGGACTCTATTPPTPTHLLLWLLLFAGVVTRKNNRQSQ